MDKSPHSKNNKQPIIGISLGDLNGIGPEVIIKALSDNRLMKIITPVIYGSTKVLSFYRKSMDLEPFNHYTIGENFNAHTKKINVKNCWEETVDLQPGQSTPEGGKYARLALESAIGDLELGNIDGLVTGPVNKANMQSDENHFIGHTELLTEKFALNGKESLMLLVNDDLRVGVVTGHIALKDIAKQLTRKKVIGKINILIKSLQSDFGIVKPKIAVLGLNPHAGEEGLLGEEENEIIAPALNEVKKKGHLIFGPFPADGFFGTGDYKRYDAVLAMYHDQGLIPFKTLAFDDGVNFTAGISIIRTSPDHGTAFNIAGKNKASHLSMLSAIFLAADIVKNRTVLDQEERQEVNVL